MTKEPQILENGIVLDYLGMELTKTDARIYVSMTEYTNKIVDYMKMNEPGMRNSKVSYPFNPTLGDKMEENPVLSKQDKKIFLTCMGMINWLVSCFRANLAYSHSMVAQSMATPTKKAYEQLCWIVRYLKGTTNLAAFSQIKEAQ